MTEREMLELAAKAAGIKLTYRHGSDSYYYDDLETGREQWYPLGNDRQALRRGLREALARSTEIARARAKADRERYEQIWGKK